MSHSIITSSGFVIQARDYGENQVMASIFARELGLVLAVAQGIRTETSKLRPYIIDFAWGSYSFVRGRDMWRLVGASELEDGRVGGKEYDRGQVELVARVASILKRFLQGEEPHPELFDALRSFFFSIQSDAMLVEKFSAELESLIVFRIMHLLGYIGTDGGLEPELYSGEVSPELLGKVELKRLVINKHINKALKESQL